MACNHWAEMWQNPCPSHVCDQSHLRLHSQGGKDCMDVPLPQLLLLIYHVHLAPVAVCVNSACSVVP